MPEKRAPNLAEMNKQRLRAAQAKAKEKVIKGKSKQPLNYEQASEMFMKEHKIQEQTFGIMEYSYKKIFTQMGKEIQTQVQRAAEELSKDANVPYIKAYSFVQWANWEIYRREMQKKE